MPINELFVIVLLIAVSAFFSMSEISLAASRKIKLRLMAEGGQVNAQRVLALQDNPGNFFTVVQIGLNAVAILGGVDGRQAAAYLQPGMLNGFFQALDGLPLSGSLVSERLLDAQGQILENRLLLPMGGARGIRQVSYTFLADDTGGQSTVVVEHAPRNPANAAGAMTSLSFAGGPAPGSGEVSYAGTLTFQPEAGTEGFTVAAPEGEVPSRAYGFNLLFAPSPEAVDNAVGASTRDFEFTLLVTPQGDGAPAPQSIKGTLQLQSRLNSRSATYFTGRLTWTDQGSQAQITANFTGNTAPPWNIPAIDPAGATRVDGLNAAQMQGLREQVQSTLQGALTALVAQGLMPPTQP